MLKIGHRGACGYAPENTLASFRKALELGVDGYEFDIQLSSDGVPMVIHDATLKRTTNATGLVSDFRARELQQMDAGLGEGIPTLQDVFELTEQRCRLFIELKAEHCETAVVDMINHYVRRGWDYAMIWVCSFDHFQIQQVTKLDPHISTCALIAGIPVSLAQCASDAGAQAINPCIEHTSKALVHDAHWRGLKVFAWTANSAPDIARARQLGVDGIISDFPDRL